MFGAAAITVAFTSRVPSDPSTSILCTGCGSGSERSPFFVFSLAWRVHGQNSASQSIVVVTHFFANGIGLRCSKPRCNKLRGRLLTCACHSVPPGTLPEKERGGRREKQAGHGGARKT